MEPKDAAAKKGIETSFVDALGRYREVSIDVLNEFLHSIPDWPRHELLPDELIHHGKGTCEVKFQGRVGERLTWSLFNGAGSPVDQGLADNGQVLLAPPNDGVFQLRVESAAGIEDQASLLSFSGLAYQGQFGRKWLLAVQLYGIRSHRNWGIGDFTDLADVMRWASRAGAAGIGLNPLHVLFDDEPTACSPYSPNSRLFLNAMYLDVERVPGFANGIQLASSLASLRTQTLVDYGAVADLKWRALRGCFAGFKSESSLEDSGRFARFREREGKRLRDFACFEVLRDLNDGPWWEWPARWSSPDDAALAAFRGGEHGREIEFVEFVQWCAHEQLQACCDLGRELGMPVGLYLDVAVGARADGFDAWYEQTAISRALSVGVPPDILNTAGQDWGLAGFNPAGLAARSFQPFRDMLAASMRYAGAIRLDHVLGLKRLYLVPRGYRPDQGAYVRMPLEMLLGLAALESRANNCVVIGEDLGTVPEGFRERLADWGIWSYRVVMFEREGARQDGDFILSDDYPEMSLATFSTHDLPTFDGWLAARDIEVKTSLGIDPGETMEERADAIQRFSNVLQSPTTIQDAIGFMSRTPSKLLAVAIEDLLGVVDQANVPGTVEEHPNWRRKLPVPVEDWNEHIDVVRLRAELAARNIDAVSS